MTEFSLSVQEADEILTARGKGDWAGGDETRKAAAIQNAIDYIKFNYGPFKSSVEPTNADLLLAIALLAYQLDVTPVPLAGSQLVKTERLKNGTKELETTYQDSDKAPLGDPFPFVASILAPLRATAAQGASVTFGRLVR